MGGGSGSGAISHSSYMEAQHKQFLNSNVTKAATLDIVEAMNAAFIPSSNPFTGTFAYSPDVDLTASTNAIAALKVLIDAHNYTGDTSTALATLNPLVIVDTATLDTATLPVDTLDVFVIDETLVKADVLAYSTSLEADLIDLTLPKFKANMLNVGASLSSSFVLGEAILRKEKIRQVAIFEADLRQKLQLQANEINSRFRLQHKDKATDLRVQFEDLTAKFKIQRAIATNDFKNQRWVTVRTLVTQALQNLMKKAELEVELARYTIESNRLKIIAKTEQGKENLLILEHDRRWNLEVFQYGTSVLGGIGSGALVPGKKSQTVSALAGALGGAATGATIGTAVGSPGIGTAAGAVIGAVAGYLSA